ncbi:MAG: MFS transporter [Opitutaceae bacterium]
MPVPSHDPYAALRFSSYLRFLAGNFLHIFGRQMLAVAVAWQVYEWTGSATALGLMGFLHAIPLLLLTLPAGQLADRVNRKWILCVSLLISGGLTGLLATLTFWPHLVPDGPLARGANDVIRQLALFFERQVDPDQLHFDHPALPVVYLIVFLTATVRIISGPARTALLPQILPLTAFSNAVTWNASVFGVANVAGPALGGFIIAYAGFAPVYLFDACSAFAFFFLLLPIRYRAETVERPGLATEHLFAGLRFVWTDKRILSAITLDLFAVLFGGAVALLPIYADRILGVGAIGLGWLRAAPAIGSMTMALFLAHRPPMKRPGITLIRAVAGFGLAIIGFGLSTWFPLSLIFLLLSGALDNVSVVVRHSLVQLLTPDSMRGRVSAINQIFIGSSNELGGLRAGLMAAWLGAVPATIIGGIITIAVTAGVARLWPGIRSVPPLNTIQPEREATTPED